MSGLLIGEFVRNARLAAIAEAVGPSPELRLLDGDGRLLAAGLLPAQWLTKPTGGVSEIAGRWQIKGVADGRAELFALWSTTRKKVALQGAVTGIDGAGPMRVDSAAVRVGYTVNVVSFTLKERE